MTYLIGARSNRLLIKKSHTMNNMIGVRVGFPVGQSVLYEPELLTYISGLSTELSDEQLGLLNTFILTIKAGFPISNLSDHFDAIWIGSGETLESSKRNLVQRLYDAVSLDATTDGQWQQYSGFKGAAGLPARLSTGYIPSAHGVNFQLNDNSHGVE